MLVICPDCVSSYRVDAPVPAGQGAASHCAHCRQPLRAPSPMPALDGSSASRDAGPVSGMLAALALVLLASALLAWRSPVVEAVPAAAALYQAIGLEPAPRVPAVSDLTTDWDGGRLAVAGTLANPGHGRLGLRAIRITVRDGAEQPLYSWTAPAPKPDLDPGETVRFTSTLDKPPEAGHDLAVGFVTDPVVPPADAAKERR